MKKWIAVILVTLSLCVLFIYIFIPRTISISNSLSLKSSSVASLRSIYKDEVWKYLGDSSFRPGVRLLNGVNISANSFQPQPIPGKLLLVPMKNDSVIVLWEFIMSPSKGPLDRIRNYLKGVSLKTRMDRIMKRFKAYCENSKSLYGLDIKTVSTKDTLLVGTKFQTSHYPLTEEVYNKINTIKVYIASRKVSITGVPMLHISREDSIYKCMVAIPVNERISNSGEIFFVRMVPGRFLTADVKGGPSTISHAEKMMQLYFDDFRRTSMGIPFEYLVTDRLVEKDTTKWITRLYSPVL